MRIRSNQNYSALGLLARAGVGRHNSALIVETMGANQDVFSLGVHECSGRLAVIKQVGPQGNGMVDVWSPVTYASMFKRPFSIGETGLVRAVFAVHIDGRSNLTVSQPIAWTALTLPGAQISDVNKPGQMERIMDRRSVRSTRDLFVGDNGKIRVHFGKVPEGFGLDLPNEMGHYADLLVSDHRQEVTLAHQ